MIRDALEYIVKLRAPELHDIEGRQYADKDLVSIQPPIVGVIPVGTLTGFLALIEAEVENLSPDEIFVHVVTHNEVRLLVKKSDIWKRRIEYARATWNDPVKYPFGTFLGPEEFVIKLQSCFDPGRGDLDALISTCSNLASEAVATAEDDGFSQTAIVKRGVVSKDYQRLKPRVKLAPFRTFREIEQVESEFLFRLRGGGDDEPPQCALIEADGGKWKLDAVQALREYLERMLAASELTGADNVPVIA